MAACKWGMTEKMTLSSNLNVLYSGRCQIATNDRSVQENKDQVKEEVQKNDNNSYREDKDLPDRSLVSGNPGM